MHGALSSCTAHLYQRDMCAVVPWRPVRVVPRALCRVVILTAVTSRNIDQHKGPRVVDGSVCGHLPAIVVGFRDDTGSREQGFEGQLLRQFSTKTQECFCIDPAPE
jgi:hypothetical protein